MEATEQQVDIKTNVNQLAQTHIALYSQHTANGIEEAQSTEIDCMEMRTFADAKRREIATARKKLDEVRKTFTRPIRELEKATNELFSPAIAALEEIETIWQQKISGFDKAESERQRKLEEEARAAAAAERARIERENAERARREREAAEALQRQAQEAARSGNTDHAAALVAEAQNKQASAAVIEATPVHVPVPVVGGRAAKPKGSSYTRKKWKARVVDREKVPRAYCSPDQQLLDALADSSNGQAKVEGVEFYQDETFVGR